MSAQWLRVADRAGRWRSMPLADDLVGWMTPEGLVHQVGVLLNEAAEQGLDLNGGLTLDFSESSACAPEAFPMIPQVQIDRLHRSPFRRDRWAWTVTVARSWSGADGYASETGTAYTEHQAHADATDAIWRLP